MKKIIILTLFILFFAIFLFFIFFKKDVYNSENKVCFKENCFSVELAIKEPDLQKGLMYREKLEENRGMLFIFEKEDKYPFWMKNTLIPLDIIWINENKEVVFISKNSQPCRELICKSTIPEENSKYVLEINGGLADKINLNLGDKLTFRLDELQ